MAPHPDLQPLATANQKVIPQSTAVQSRTERGILRASEQNRPYGTPLLYRLPIQSLFSCAMENGAAASQSEGTDPSAFLSEIIGSPVVVKLNSGVVYKGERQMLLPHPLEPR